MKKLSFLFVLTAMAVSALSPAIAEAHVQKKVVDLRCVKQSTFCGVGQPVGRAVMTAYVSKGTTASHFTTRYTVRSNNKTQVTIAQLIQADCAGKTLEYLYTKKVKLKQGVNIFTTKTPASKKLTCRFGSLTGLRTANSIWIGKNKVAAGISYN